VNFYLADIGESKGELSRGASRGSRHHQAHPPRIQRRRRHKNTTLHRDIIKVHHHPTSREENFIPRVRDVIIHLASSIIQASRRSFSYSSSTAFHFIHQKGQMQTLWSLVYSKNSHPGHLLYFINPEQESYTNTTEKLDEWARLSRKSTNYRNAKTTRSEEQAQVPKFHIWEEIVPEVKIQFQDFAKKRR